MADKRPANGQDGHEAEEREEGLSPVSRRAFLGNAVKTALIAGLGAVGLSGCIGIGGYLDFAHAHYYGDYSNYGDYSDYYNYGDYADYYDYANYANYADYINRY